VKPVAEGTAKGIDANSKVNSPEQLERTCRYVLTKFRQPALVEPFLPGREFTTGITGTGHNAEVIATLEVELLEGAEPDAYTYVNKERCEELCRYTLADPDWGRKAAKLSLDAWRVLECRDAGRVDLRADANGQLQVMEVNPLPGLHPEHSDLPILCSQVGMSYVELIRRIMDSAVRRLPAPRSKEASLVAAKIRPFQGRAIEPAAKTSKPLSASRPPAVGKRAVVPPPAKRSAAATKGRGRAAAGKLAKTKPTRKTRSTGR
jgi:D-alanine-D-alanine ligase